MVKKEKALIFLLFLIIPIFIFGKEILSGWPININTPGSHTIKFIYSPFSFKLGALITIITLIGCIEGIIYLKCSN